MLFDYLTGLLGFILIAFCLSYLMRRQFNGKSRINKLKYHAISGYVALFIVIIHIRNQFLHMKLSPGFITFAALLFIILTGVLKRRFRRKRAFYLVHVFFVVVFVFALLIHVGQQVINSLLF